ncbi:MAG TPA: hypothetical protein VGI73_06040 [Solirubrobacterales bacterium]|jgi:hypothetical protein
MKSRRFMALVVAAVTALALAIPVAGFAAGQPGQKVEIKSTITINPYGSAGKVSASNPNCTEDRHVVVKQVGIGKIGGIDTSSTGSWRVEPNYKGKLPFKVYAEVKPDTQGTAGTIYKCLAAKSRVVEIAGG